MTTFALPDAYQVHGVGADLGGDLTDEPIGLTAGAQTAGHYRLLGLLGSGSHGTVCSGQCVFDPSDRTAVKRIPTGQPGEAAAAERFLNAAWFLQSNPLPGCLPVQSAGQDFGFAYVVMPWVEGGSLDDRMHRAVVPLAEATDLCRQAAAALAAVHRAGLAHGNLRAANLLLTPTGVLLSDLALPAAAFSAPARTVPGLQRGDVAALVGVYADLLPPPNSPTGADPVTILCRRVTEQRFDSADELAAALDAVATELGGHPSTSGRTWITQTVSAARTRTLPDVRTPQPGDLLGKCRLGARIGEGATGVVFQATHQTLGIDVAVKVLAGLSRDAGKANLFNTEARLLARLNHANIIRVWDFEAESEFPPFLVLEYVAGRTLADRLETEGRLPAAEAAAVFAQVAAGLGAAHRQAGVIHRDVKPANILLGADGAVKVSDLGLAVVRGTETGSGGRHAGTPAYMSPEQFGAFDSVDYRSDVYSLGVSLYQAVTGALPFTGGSLTEVMLQHAMEDPVPPDHREPSCPPRLAAVILKAMAKSPDDRFQSYDELHAALTASVAPVEGDAEPQPKKASAVRRIFDAFRRQ